MDEPKPQVTLEPVEATMSSPMFDGESPETVTDPDVHPATPELQAIRVGRRVEPRIEVVIVATVAAATLFAADARVAVMVGSLGLAVVALRRLDGHVPFSFGEGFVGYRGDPGWPRGVQEDDDVRWNWKARPASRRS